MSDRKNINKMLKNLLTNFSSMSWLEKKERERNKMEEKER